MILQGVYTALVTPFDKNGSIDKKALQNLVDFQIKEGISGLVPVGTTGESPTLNNSEHHTVIKIVLDQTNGRVPVIAGTGSNSTEEAVELTKNAKKTGADFSLQVAPYYNKPSQEGFYRHFSTIADSVDIPLIIYNIPGRSGKNIENSTMLKLAKHQNIVAVKEASGNLAQVMDIIRLKPDDFTVLSGDDNLGLPIIALGGRGIVSVASNLIPAKMEALVKAALMNDMEKARELHYELLPFFKGEFIETNPIPIKYALAVKGMVKEIYRLPLCSMDDEKKTIFKTVMETLDIL